MTECSQCRNLVVIIVPTRTAPLYGILRCREEVLAEIKITSDAYYNKILQEEIKIRVLIINH